MAEERRRSVHFAKLSIDNQGLGLANKHGRIVDAKVLLSPWREGRYIIAVESTMASCRLMYACE